MNLRDLNYLITLHETKHFGQAAKRCFVSQPTLSTQIKKLEDELGVLLVERNNKSVLFTKTGDQIVALAKEALQTCNQIKETAKLSQDPFCATIHLSLIPTVGPYLLPKVIQNIKKQLPKANLFLHEEKTDDALSLLQNGSIDAAIMALPVPIDQVTTKKLYKEEFYAALPKNHSLSKKKQLTINDIPTEELLLLAEGHCLRDQALDACHLQSTPSDYESTSLETLRYMVASGAGITLLPKSATEIKNKLVEIRPFKNPAPYREIVMVWRKGSPNAACLEAIAEIISQQY